MKKNKLDLCDENNDNNNRTMGRTLIFRNIIQEQRNEIFPERESLVDWTINKVMLGIIFD